jgi:hypothetical protein
MAVALVLPEPVIITANDKGIFIAGVPADTHPNLSS